MQICFSTRLLPRGLLKTFDWNKSPTSLACFTEELPEPIPEANLKNAELKKTHHKQYGVTIEADWFNCVTSAKTQVIEANEIILLLVGNPCACVGRCFLDIAEIHSWYSCGVNATPNILFSTTFTIQCPTWHLRVTHLPVVHPIPLSPWAPIKQKVYLYHNISAVFLFWKYQVVFMDCIYIYIYMNM